MKYKPIMILGTGSHVGKTTVVAGVCRHFANQGLRVAPFKSQNMSLNSYSTLDGKEIARSIAFQAQAAKTTPCVHMNPILLKPESDTTSQVIVHGEVVGSFPGHEYFSPDWFHKKSEVIKKSISFLRQNYDLIVAEGAGSCAEPNFVHNDLVNLGLAELLDADVYLVVDIDKGGAFAEIMGTLRILEIEKPESLKRIQGVVLNKFRGETKILQPAIDFITQHTNIPIVGIIPYLPNLNLEEEDQVKSTFCHNPEIDIAVLYLPHISNTSDFTPLTFEDGVRVRYVRSPETIGAPDLIILPGTKNTAWDLNFLREIGWAEALESLITTTPIMGICGGFEMMGQSIKDPFRIESEHEHISGLGYFNFTTTMTGKKKVAQVTYSPTEHNPFRASGKVKGYEIHCGQIENLEAELPLFQSNSEYEGAIRENPFVFGTFIHDIFKNNSFSRELVNFLRLRKNLPKLTTPLIQYEELIDRQFDLLAERTLFAGRAFSPNPPLQRQPA